MTASSNQDHAAAARRLATIEAGGTKFNVGIGNGTGAILSQAEFETRAPDETFAQVRAWLDREIDRSGPIAAIGIASFGPIDVDRASAGWAHLGLTPKLAWRGADMAGWLRGYGVPIALDTDVNGAALGEWRWGAARGTARACYLTVGTGIGGGAVLDGKMLSGRSHPEMGHMYVRRQPDDPFAGVCPTHGDCLEGLASGPAIRARWGTSLSGLPAEHPGQALIADYLAQACINIAVTLAPEKLILGGGVLGTTGLLEHVRDRFEALANGYLANFAGEDIVRPKFFPLSGLVGGLAIAEMALAQSGR